ncbi:PTI1-like tyrosine-protein kinase At3g15890 isoform X2 [Carex rostrata]
MDWCKTVGKTLWALLTFPISLPLICILLLLATLCGLTGEFMIWVLPVKKFPKGLVNAGNQLVSVAKKVLECWLLTKHRGGVATLETTNAMENKGITVIQPTLTKNENVIFGFPKIGFTYEELIIASDGFSDYNFIGKGGFGSVYKGKLEDGREVAIKQLSVESRWGARDFIVEVDVLSRVHHRHLVQLIGCCITQEKRMLVCEYVTNNTLHFHLHETRESFLDWPTRLKIALGSAKALSYLHEDCQPRIIHRDIKAANILLENSFEAKVADFGLAKFFPDGETHVCATQFVGTRGYLAPEIAMGEIREKSDTYSYGVVLLELITGKRPLVHTDSSTECLADWVWPLLLKALADDNYNKIVDPRLATDYNLEEMKLMVTCAFACVRRSPQARPPMSQVVLVLEGIATADTLSEELIQSSGNLSCPDTFSTSSSNSEHVRTESTRSFSAGIETEYMTACIDLHLSDNADINRNSSANTSHQIGSHVGSIDNAISYTNQSAYFDAPEYYSAISDDEAPLRHAITHVTPAPA